jgi:gas vesicle protein
MADSFDRYDNENSGNGGFMMGLLTGTVLGAGLGMLLAPKAGSELRGAIGEQARTIGNAASEQYKKASEAAGTLAERGQGARSGHARRRRSAQLCQRHDGQQLQLRQHRQLVWRRIDAWQYGQRFRPLVGSLVREFAGARV